MQRLGHCLASVWNPLAMRCPHLAHLGTGCAEASRLEVQLFRVFLQLAQPQPQPQPQPPAMSKNRKCIAGQTGRAQFAANVKLSCGSDARRWLSLVNHGTIKLRTTIHPLFTHYSPTIHPLFTLQPLFSHYSATIQPLFSHAVSFTRCCSTPQCCSVALQSDPGISWPKHWRQSIPQRAQKKILVNCKGCEGTSQDKQHCAQATWDNNCIFAETWNKMK